MGNNESVIIADTVAYHFLRFIFLPLCEKIKEFVNYRLLLTELNSWKEEVAKTLTSSRKVKGFE